METLRVAVCEDSPEERASVLALLESCGCPTEVSDFSSGEAFLAQFTANQYDLIFMDIYMEELTGVQVITRVRELDPDVPVAFLTSSLDFTLESYRLGVLKYLEKPATAQGVQSAILLAQQHLAMAERVILSANGDSCLLSRLVYLEQTGRTVVAHLLGGETVTTHKKLGELELQLEGKAFLRCHKSFLVNLAFVRALDPDLSIFEMEGGDKVHIRRESFWTAKKAFEAYLFGG